MEPINIRFTAHLTDDFQFKSLENAYKKVKEELGAANAYIQELEENRDPEMLELRSKIVCLETEIQKLTKDNEKLKQQIKDYNDKYSKDVQELIRTDVLYKKCIDKINGVVADCKKVKAKNEELVMEIIRLRNQ